MVKGAIRMAISVTCPACGTQAKAADSAAGRKGRCKKCGGIIAIPSLAATAELGQTKDAKGRLPVLAKAENTATLSASRPAAASANFGSDPSTASPHVGRSLTSTGGETKTQSAISETGKRRALRLLQNRKVQVGLGVVVIVALSLGYALFYPHGWEAENHDRVVALSQRATALATDGKLQDASVAYDQLFEFLSYHEYEVHGSDLKDIIKSAHSARDRIDVTIAEQKKLERDAQYSRNAERSRHEQEAESAARDRQAKLDRQTANIFRATELGYKDRIIELLKNFPELVNQKTSNYSSDSATFVHLFDGYTPLFFSPNIDIAELLIKYGADVNYKGGLGNLTPLHLVAQRCDLKMAEVLVRHGANLNARDSFDRTPFYYAEERLDKDDSDQQCLDMLKYLVSQGADVREDVSNIVEIYASHWKDGDSTRKIEFLLSLLDLNARRETCQRVYKKVVVLEGKKALAKLFESN
jgi:hypothetical protein